MKKYQKLGAIITLLLGGASIANATDLYNNIPLPSPPSPTSIWPNLNGYVVEGGPGTGQNGNDILANEFSIGSSCINGCNLQDVNLLLAAYSPVETSSLVVDIYSNGNNVPGTLLYTLSPTVTSVYTPDAVPVEVEFNAAAGGDSLPKGTGTDYWVVLSSSDQTNQLFWMNNNQPGDAQGTNLLNGQGVDYQGLPGNGNVQGLGLIMQVQALSNGGTASVIPVPGAAWLMGSALIGLLSSWNRKSRHSID